jgi:hypothetical protein
MYIVSMRFDPILYGERVASILALDGNGERLMPLVARQCSSPAARELLEGVTPRELFPRAKAPAGALAGLWVYFSCFDEAHETAQDDSSTEGSYWHAILHRQEPDAGNSAYWFRRVGRHSVYRGLAALAADIIARHPGIRFESGADWDPLRFVAFCEVAREQPGTELETTALEIQRAEWQLLFDYCAQSAS